MTDRREPGPLSTLAVEVLLTLAEGPLHGYAVKQRIEERIGDGFLLGSGSLYQALQRLERRKLVAEAAAPAGADPRRGRVYRLEPAGRQALVQELGRMKRLMADARRQRIPVGAVKS
jgi:PadR family transcriptional regulator PadR